MESDGGLTALFACGGTHQSASPGLRDRVPMLVDRAYVLPEVAHSVSVPIVTYHFRSAQRQQNSPPASVKRSGDHEEADRLEQLAGNIQPRSRRRRNLRRRLSS